ncbi:hypothetical protein J3R82DRAFT_9099 [Butyriboletus roseoflavus]|nr:hypothetical protein J3R82DRAFT_9099 [Butyriboletus roseoflavus]
MHLPYKNQKLNVLIPKFHLPAHIAECQWKYSFNFIKGMGWTDGEAPERGWSTLNTVMSSAKQMEPGHHCDTFKDLIGDSNWKKVKMIYQKIMEAMPEQNDHQEDIQEFENSLKKWWGTQLLQWKADIEAWEKDMLKPNPFEIKRRLRVDLEKLGPHATDQQKVKLLQRSNGLMRRIEAWSNVQTLYIHSIAWLHVKAALDSGQVQKPENFHLWLPSVLRCQALCDIRLEEVE